MHDRGEAALRPPLHERTVLRDRIRATVANDVGERARADISRSSPTGKSREGPIEVLPGRSFMNLKPLGDRLIVEVLDEEELTVSGIVLPDTAKEKPQRGKVLAVGPGARNQETGEYLQMEVVEGDEVIFSKYGGTEIKVGADEILILRESDVLAKAVHTGGKRKRTLSGATA
jgi:chaperonin GroES